MHSNKQCIATVQSVCLSAAKIQQLTASDMAVASIRVLHWWSIHYMATYIS